MLQTSNIVCNRHRLVYPFIEYCRIFRLISFMLLMMILKLIFCSEEFELRK